jgi:hypothetical protein
LNNGTLSSSARASASAVVTLWSCTVEQSQHGKWRWASSHCGMQEFHVKWMQEKIRQS